MEKTVVSEALEDNARVCVRVIKEFGESFETQLKEFETSFQNQRKNFHELKEKRKLLETSATPSLMNADKVYTKFSQLAEEMRRILEASSNFPNPNVSLTYKALRENVIQSQGKNNKKEGEIESVVCETKNFVTVPEAHVDIIRKFYTQLHYNLTRTVEIVNMMLQKDKLTQAEHEEIRQSNNIYTANDRLLKLLLNKSPDVYDCFVDALKICMQTHLYQLLHTSGYDLNMSHAKRIRSHYVFLTENLDCEYLLGRLWAEDVISFVEMEEIKSERTSLRQTQKLLSLIAMKPAEIFPEFLKALALTGQTHVSTKLTEESATGVEESCTTLEIEGAPDASSKPENILRDVTSNDGDNTGTGKTRAEVENSSKLLRIESKTQIVDFHQRITELHKDLVTIICTKILVLRKGQGASDPYLLNLVRDAATIVQLQPTLNLMKKSIAEIKQELRQDVVIVQRRNDELNNEFIAINRSCSQMFGDIARGNENLKLKLLQAEVKENQLLQNVQELKEKSSKLEDENKKLKDLLKYEIRKSTEDKQSETDDIIKLQKEYTLAEQRRIGKELEKIGVEIDSKISPGRLIGDIFYQLKQ